MIKWLIDVNEMIMNNKVVNKFDDDLNKGLKKDLKKKLNSDFIKG